VLLAIFLAIPNQYLLQDSLAIQQKNLCIRVMKLSIVSCYIKIRCLNIPLWKIIDEQECVAQKTLLEETMWSPEFNNAAIVEYTAAIPEAKAKPAVAPSILHTFSTNSLVFGLL
jgi:hypothetical protein